MSQPPDQVLGREDLANMTIFCPRVSNSLLTFVEKYNLQDCRPEVLAAYLLRKSGKAYTTIAESLGVSPRTAKRWFVFIDEVVW